MEISTNAKDLVADPESYNKYVNRQRKQRDMAHNEHRREKSLPGSGNIWVNKPTKPMVFSLATESGNNYTNRAFGIKSLNKVC